MAYRTVNPFNNEVVATFDDLTDAEVRNLLAQAQKTFESWSQTSFGERAAVCKRAAAILTERPDEFARLLTLEMGKLYKESLGEVELTAEIFEYYADNAEAFLAPERLVTADPDDDAEVVSAHARASNATAARIWAPRLRHHQRLRPRPHRHRHDVRSAAVIGVQHLEARLDVPELPVNLVAPITHLLDGTAA